jgi:VWFA-related protein
MRRLWLMLLCGLAWGQPQPDFRVDSRLVPLSVGVSTKDRAVSGLQRQDFVVLDNGRTQEILSFQPESAVLDVILLVDVSTSIGASFDRLRSLALASIKDLRPEDRVGIIAFAQHRLLVLPPTFDHVLASAEMKMLRATVPFTELNRNVVETARYLSEVARPRSQAVVLIFSDNIGSSSLKLDKALEEMGESDVLLNLVRFHPRSLVGRNLDELAAATGGYVMWASEKASPMAELLQRIRGRYQLTYAPRRAEPGTRHRIEVRLAKTPRTLAAKSKGEVWRLHHRSGYTVSARLPSR